MSDQTTNSLPKDPTPSYLLAANAVHHLRLFHEGMRELGKYSKLEITLNNTPLVSEATTEASSAFSMQISPEGISVSLPETNGLSLNPTLDQHASLRPILFNNPFLSDCLISIKGQSRQYYCHRSYLSEESEYFNAMFRPSYSESEKRELEISLEHPEMFEEALRYVYKRTLSDKHVCSGRWRSPIDSYFQLLWVANYLQTSKLLTALTNLFEISFSSSPLFNSEYMTFSLFQSVITSCRHKLNPRAHTTRSRGDLHWMRSKYSSNRLSSPYNSTKRMRRIMSRSSSSMSSISRNASSSLSSLSHSPDWPLHSYFESNHSPVTRRSRSRSVSIDPNRYIPSVSADLDSSWLESSGIFDDTSDSVCSNSNILETTFFYAENSNRNNSRLGTSSDECKEVLEWASAENITGELWDSDVVNVIKSFPGAVQKAVDPYGLLSKTKGKYNQ